MPKFYFNAEASTNELFALFGNQCCVTNSIFFLYLVSPQPGSLSNCSDVKTDSAGEQGPDLQLFNQFTGRGFRIFFLLGTKT